MDNYSYLSNLSPESVESLYHQYLQDPASVDLSWQRFFEGFGFARSHYDFLPTTQAPKEFLKEFRVMALIHAYRQRGHLFTATNPVRERRKYSPNLDISHFGLELADLHTVFQAGNEIGIGAATLQQIIERLQEIYCQHIGIEYLYVRDPEKTEWLRKKFESLPDQPAFDKEKRKRILTKLQQAVGFEKYLHKKFVGQKRFSLEGGESLLPALEMAICRGAELSVEEFVIGMTHRGRLNVLANIFHKPYRQIFKEFEGFSYEDVKFDGDVKYHLGYNNHITTATGKSVMLNLLPNPSHLETVGPVSSGLCRAFAENKFKSDFSKTATILIHGDAAIAGQGVVYELLQMSKLEGYRTGGTIHMVVNNQVGFTTNYLEGRSSTYCTDVAKVVLSPVFHVNADDVEAVVKVVELAMEYRQRYRDDVFIDLLGYRKHGHNEGDEPRFTQPRLYKIIDKHPNPYQLYIEKLIQSDTFSSEEIKALDDALNRDLDENLDQAKQSTKGEMTPFLYDLYKPFRSSTHDDFIKSPDTSIKKEKLQDLLIRINYLPPGMHFNRKIEKIFADRAEMVKQNRLDWALGEQLAYATLLDEGISVRLSGQDSVRGTFSHRHAILKLDDTEEEYMPLSHISENQARFSVFNSPLSEYAVLGFDYGYALGTPYGLTLWEAQFGDFNNGAQIIIDQYISSAEDKWKTQNGLVLLLPHGYEGQGAEHSSARLERFLNISAEQNIQVVNCTTPANFFHALRRQLARPFRKPLVVMTPKSLLRHPECVSPIESFSQGGFKELIDDDVIKPEQVKRLVFCSGKFYYDLLEQRRKTNIQEVALIRLEQLFPFPKEQVAEIFVKYNRAESIIWAQEEPENMGAWGYVLRILSKGFDKRMDVIAQPASASPATGSSKMAAQRHQSVINEVFNFNHPIKSGKKNKIVQS